MVLIFNHIALCFPSKIWLTYFLRSYQDSAMALYCIDRYLRLLKSIFPYLRFRGFFVYLLFRSNFRPKRAGLG